MAALIVATPSNDTKLFVAHARFYIGHHAKPHRRFPLITRTPAGQYSTVPAVPVAELIRTSPQGVAWNRAMRDLNAAMSVFYSFSADCFCATLESIERGW